MFRFLFENHTPQNIPTPGIDPRGGKLIDLQNTLFYNNLSTPYRGGDFQARHLDPATGVPLSYMQSLPGLDVQQNSTALNAVLHGLVSKQQNNPRGTNQRYYEGMSFGVTVAG